MDIRLGDVLRMKKGHPCGGNEWLVLRVGMDFRLQCKKCDRMIMIPRKLAEKNLRQLTRDGVTLKPADLAVKRTEEVLPEADLATVDPRQDTRPGTAEADLRDTQA